MFGKWNILVQSNLFKITTTKTITTIFICTHSCSKITYNNENIKSKKLEKWLPGITMGASGARQPKGQNQVSVLQRRPYYRDRECMIFGISGTKRTVRNREVSVRRG